MLSWINFITILSFWDNFLNDVDDKNICLHPPNLKYFMNILL